MIVVIFTGCFDELFRFLSNFGGNFWDATIE
jgi:hypothetical protein